MPNKDECLNAIDVIARYCNEVKQGHVPPRFELTNELDVLMQLINEHFDNPPLKFEELEPDMWVWDNLVKGYMRIYGKEIKYNEELVEYCCGFIDFEENRFYRWEVKDNEH